METQKLELEEQDTVELELSALIELTLRLEDELNQLN